jgi:hypothetical protein
MVFRLRALLLIVLLLLQCVAPLVHAHAGGQDRAFGTPAPARLHIPGLENYSNDFTMPAFASSNHDHGVEGMIFSIESGIKQQPAQTPSSDQPTLIRTFELIKSVIFRLAVNFSPPGASVIGHPSLVSLVPRAPPTTH